MTFHQSLNVQRVFLIAQRIFLIPLGISWSPLATRKRQKTLEELLIHFRQTNETENEAQIGKIWIDILAIRKG